MVTMTIVVKVKREKREEFLQAMRSLDAERKKQKGCLKSSVREEGNNHTGFTLVHEWETQEDLDGYLCAEEFRVFLGALRVLCEKSEIRRRPF